MSQKSLQFKLVLLGESAVGKSSLVLRFVKGQFLEFQESTIGGIIYKLFENLKRQHRAEHPFNMFVKSQPTDIVEIRNFI